MMVSPVEGWIMDRVDAAIGALSTCLLVAGVATMMITYWM